jgi:hypothetical protein
MINSYSPIPLNIITLFIPNVYWMSNRIQKFFLVAAKDKANLLSFMEFFCFRVIGLKCYVTCFIFAQIGLFQFLSTFLPNLILLIAFCYWQHFSAFTSYLALGKGNKKITNWIILKFERIFLFKLLWQATRLRKYSAF